MNNTITLVVGDWSHDGHNMTDTVVVKCNHSADEVEEAHKLGCLKTGFDFDCENQEYEDSDLSDKMANFIVEHAILFDWIHPDGEEFNDMPIPKEVMDNPEFRDNFYMDSDTFAKLYMDIAQIGNPAIKYTIPPVTYENTINIGGYGLFS